MFRVWKGPELEGFDKGIITLFVASDNIINESIIINQLELNNIQRVYLGAGRTPFPGFNNTRTFIDYCSNNSIKVIIEVDGIKSLLQAETDIIKEDIVVPIYTFRVQGSNNIVKDNSLFKYDDYNQVIVFKNSQSSYTDLDTLNGMVFEADTILIDQ
jgi:hypothetical protein